ncbi:hypothetical protein PLESTM_000512400 [Pleodorina starrii]|nr:hypothetical protein PLESTM_000512400 [Pleodorina starrii]
MSCCRHDGDIEGDTHATSLSQSELTKAQQLEAPVAHICRFSPCGQYLVCFAGGFTQLVVYRFTGPRLSWQGELSDSDLAGMLASFSCFFSLLYRVQLAPAGEVLARDVVLFMASGSLLLAASHSPFAPPVPAPRPDADPLLTLPFAESITLHLVRLCDGVRVGGSRFEGELVDLSGRPSGLGVSVHEDLIAVLTLRSQQIHLLQVLRGGEEVVPVRILGTHVQEDDELVLRTAAEAEERWLRARRAEREADDAAAHAPLPPLRRSHNGDLIRATELGPLPAAAQPSAAAAAPTGALGAAGSAGVAAGAAAAAAAAAPGLSRRPHAAAGRGAARPAVGPGRETVADLPAGRSPPAPPRYDTVGLGVGAIADNLGGGNGGAGGGDVAGGSGAAGHNAVLYPPERTGGGHDAAAAAAAAAQAAQAAARQRARQRQYEQLEAQGGPGHPPAAARRSLEGHRNGSPMLGADAGHADEGAGGATGLPPQPWPLPRQHQQQHHTQQHHPQQPLQVHPDSVPPRTHQQQQQQQEQQQQQPAGVPPNLQRHPAAPAAPAAAAAGQRYLQPGPSRALLPPDGEGAGGGGGGGGGGCITGIKQRLLAHLYGNCLRAHPNNPKRQQREALALFRQLDAFRSLIMRKVFLLDRRRLLIEMRKPAGADRGLAALGGGAGGAGGGGAGARAPQFFLLFDLLSTRVLRFEPGPGAAVIEAYIREATSASELPWSESLPLWDRYVYDNVVTAARSKLRTGIGAGPGGGGGAATAAAAAVPVGHGGAAAAVAEAAASGAGPPRGGAADAAAERASCAGKLMQLVPPLAGSYCLSSSPYLDTSLHNYDERVVSPYIRTRPCLEQPVFFRPRNRPDRAAFRLDPGPYEAMVVRDRLLARNVVHLFHPDAPFVLTVFSVLQQSSVNMNYRL